MVEREFVKPQLQGQGLFLVYEIWLEFFNRELEITETFRAKKNITEIYVCIESHLFDKLKLMALTKSW